MSNALTTSGRPCPRPRYPQASLSSRKARLLVADDSRDMRECLVQLLGAEFDVVAVVENGRQAVDAAVQCLPDIAVLDISMPVMDGLDALVRLRGIDPRLPVVFLTAYEDEDLLRAAREGGARGYVLKMNMASDLVGAIRSVLDGAPFVSAATS